MNGWPRGVPKITVLVAVITALVCAARPSSGEHLAPAETSIRDIDGNVYSVMQAGTQRWMGENLRVARTAAGEPLATHLPENKVVHESAFGRLYDWDSAQRACPAGWRLPSDEEWSTLEQYLGARLAASWLDEAFWRDAPSQTTRQKPSSFNARPAGYWNDQGLETRFRSVAVFWTATPAGSGIAWSRVITATDPPVRRASQHAHYGLSVRCIASSVNR
jgi:uncharacterized protein (TIGR02145 family)